MGAFLQDLGLAEDDIVAFVVSWKLGAASVSRITRSEFVLGLGKQREKKVEFILTLKIGALKCASIAALQALIPRLEGELKTHHRDVYSYAFQVRTKKKTLTKCPLIHDLLDFQTQFDQNAGY
jgi:hypothetical protein